MRSPLEHAGLTVLPQLKSEPQIDRVLSMNANMPRGLSLLHKAYLYAESVGDDALIFAVPITELHDSGIDNTDLRALISMGCLRHTCSAHPPIDHSCTVRTLTLCARCRIVLTPCGLTRLSSYLIPNSLRCDSSEPSSPAHARAQVPPVPVWDASSRTLLFKDMIIKRFQQPAENQEALLSAFQEEKWPHHIDDPLR